MEVLLSAVASDLFGRLVTFLISKLQEPGSTDDVVRLKRALLRARAVVEEAEARQVTNRAMLLQLNQLRGEMCRGAYVLDAFTRRPVKQRSHATPSRVLGLPPGRGATGGLSVAVDTLEAALSDMKESVVLLGACPRVERQPYSAYIYMERCMFGRQMEKERIIGFLLQPARELDVLPIIGPHEIGKRTLVEHVCLEERVREQFVKIHRLCTDDLDVQSQELDTTQRSLILIDFASDDRDGERWRGFLSSVRRRVHRESKVIIISRTETHSGLGTVPPIMLRAPRREELWYFFKAMAFGGADPEERPELVRIAMALFATIPDLAPLAAAHKLAAWLRADLSARYWRHALKVAAGGTELQLGAAPGDLHRPEEKTGCYYPRVPVKGAPNRPPCLFYNMRKSIGTARSELPKVTAMEVVHGVALGGTEKRFDVLAWQSRIPPYASYVATCDMERAAQVEVGKKQSLNKRRRSTDLA